MKKVVKWLLLGIFVLSSTSFAFQQTKVGSDNPPTPGGGCRCANPGNR
jgi:hypothetical protein